MYQKKNELYHYGVKGQKWGIRRYQNEDGTLTKRGKKQIKKVGELVGKVLNDEAMFNKMSEKGKGIPVKSIASYNKTYKKAEKILLKLAKEEVYTSSRVRKDSKTGREYVDTMFQNEKFDYDKLPPKAVYSYKLKN